MKRFIALVVSLLALVGCSTAQPGIPDRAEAMPDSFVSRIAGVPMKQARVHRDAASGYACWAWEETGGTPKLLFLEIWYSPADCEKLYEKASAGAQAVPAPEGASACGDGRAVYMKAGGCFVRMATLGFQEEEDAMSLLVGRLAYRLDASRG
jgi:hypothetical protein